MGNEPTASESMSRGTPQPTSPQDISAACSQRTNSKSQFSPRILRFSQQVHYQQHQLLKLHLMVLLIMSPAIVDISVMMNGTVS